VLMTFKSPDSRDCIKVHFQAQKTAFGSDLSDLVIIHFLCVSGNYVGTNGEEFYLVVFR